MKVLHIISGLSRGGAEMTLMRLIAGSNCVKHEVLVLSLHSDLEEQIRSAGALVHFINLKETWSLPFRLMAVWRYIKRSKPDIVQTWMYHADVVGGVLARLAGVRAVAWAIHHACPDAGDLGRSARLCAWLGKKLSADIPAQIIACSEATRVCHVRYGYNGKSLRVIRNGYDLRHFRSLPEARSLVRASLGIGINERLFGMVARYHPVKGHDILLEALAELKKAGASNDFKCMLVGEGVDSHNSELVKKIAGLELSGDVLLCGFRADVAQVMNAIDVLVLSSHSEAFPNVLNEAMACGTPCITTDVGDARDIVGEYGWVVSPGAPKALAVALSQALKAQTDAKRWSERREAARRHIEQNFSLDAMVRAYLACWASMLQPTRESVHG